MSAQGGVYLGGVCQRGYLGGVCLPRGVSGGGVCSGGVCPGVVYLGGGVSA